jgi:hypothetical protein
VLLKADDLRPEAVAFVGEFIDALTQQVTVNDGVGSVSRIYETGVALALSSSVGGAGGDRTHDPGIMRWSSWSNATTSDT